MPSSAPRRFGLIGFGLIGGSIVDAFRAGELPGWTLTALLARSDRGPDPLGAAGSPPIVDSHAFFGMRHDLIIECAGPRALAEHGARALQIADVWSVSAAALADPRLLAALTRAADAGGHRLRLVSGAIAGLDGIAMAAIDPQASLQLDIDMPAEIGPAKDGNARPLVAPAEPVFAGTVRDLARRHPDAANVAAAAALAGPGLDRSRVKLNRSGPSGRHRLALNAASEHALIDAAVELRLGRGCHPVAACMIANLRRELQSVWVG